MRARPDSMDRLRGREDGSVLKVAMVTNFPASPTAVAGGVEGASFYLAQGLAAFDDIDLHVIAVGLQGPETEQWRDPRLTVSRVPRSRLGLFGSWTVTRRRVERAVLAIRPDLVHVQGFGGWLGPRFPIPAVFTVHGIIEEDLRYGSGRLGRLKRIVAHAVEKRARRRYAHVIVISPYVLEVLRGQIVGATYAVENAVAPACFEVERREVPNRVLYVGSIGVRKNIHGLLDAARRLAADGVDFRFRLAGGGATSDYQARLEKDVATFGLGGRVEFLGPLAPEAVRAEMSRAACFVLASFQETAPVVISEAMAAGVPVVATAVCGVPAMVEDGHTGFTVPSGDMAALADRIRKVLESDPLRRRMGDRAVQAARRRFHPQVVTGRTREVYCAALGRDRGS